MENGKLVCIKSPSYAPTREQYLRRYKELSKQLLPEIARPGSDVEEPYDSCHVGLKDEAPRSLRNAQRFLLGHGSHPVSSAMPSHFAPNLVTRKPDAA
jgi:hypothetical protein